MSDVAVARSGRELGFGMETQAREEAAGLKSARGRIRRVAVVVMLFGVKMVEEKLLIQRGN